jgi:transposase
MSQHIRGISREQVALLPTAVEDYVGANCLPRVIDEFVKGLDLRGLGFVRSEAAHTGRPGYAADDLLKLYLYGYWNKIRSSRRLEAECKRNLELMWLLGQLTPDHKSIAEFRKINSKAFQQACSQFTAFLRDASLIGGEAPVVAIDGSRFKANAAKASLMNAEQLAKEQQRTMRRVAEYVAQLDQADRQEAGQAEPDAAHIRKVLEQLKVRAAALEKAKAELEKTKQEGKTRVGLTDPDSVMLSKNGSTVVGYNVQHAVDSQHKLIVAHEVITEHNDHTSLQPMATQATGQGRPAGQNPHRHLRHRLRQRCPGRGLRGTENHAGGAAAQRAQHPPRRGLYQSPVYLRQGQRHLALPGGAVAHPFQTGSRQKDRLLPHQGLRGLRAKGAMHRGQTTQHRALVVCRGDGTGRCAGQGQPCSDAFAQCHGRTPLWQPEGDARRRVSGAHPAQSQGGDGAGGIDLQSEASTRYPGI